MRFAAQCCTSLVLLAVTMTTHAQSKPAVLEEVMVTAQKREESLQDVPISVVAISAEAMQDANIEDLADVANFTPNLAVISHPPFTSLRVRGLGSPFDKGFEHSAGLFLDGVYVGRLAFIDAAFLDVASVEILRGPQGTLFGKNTISGAISIRSVQPSQEGELTGEAQTGDEDYEKYSLAANLPLGDSIAIRAAAQVNHRDGPVYNTTLDRSEGGVESRAGRIQLRWDIGSSTSLTLAAASVEQDFRLGSFQIRTASDDQFQLMQFYDPRVEMDVTDQQSSQNYPAMTAQDGNKFDIRLSTMLWEHELSWITARSSITEDSNTDLDFSPIPLLFFFNGEDYEQTSTELRIVSPLAMLDGKLDYVAGVYASRSDTDIRVIIDAAPNPSELISGFTLLGNASTIGSLLAPAVDGGPGERLLIDGFQEGSSLAVYGQASWHFSDEFTLTAGLRYSRDIKEVDQQLQLFSAGTDADGPVFTQLVTAEEYHLITDRTDRSLTPKLSLNWQPDDDITVYLSGAEGFKAGGYSGSSVRAEITEVEPENSKTYELGAKTRLLGGAATLNVATFYTEFEDLQLTIFEGNVSRISNAAGALSKGAELDAAFITEWGFSGNLALAYLDATFTDYTNAPCPAESEADSCDLTGKYLHTAPLWKSTLSLNYRHELGSLPWNILVGVDTLYSDKQLLQPDQDPVDRQEAYTTFNARLRLADDMERWSLQALLRNFTDKHALDASGDIPTLSGAHYARAIAPRQLDVSLRFRF